MENGNCPVCDFPEAKQSKSNISAYDYIIEISCPRCGRYRYLSNIIDEKRGNKIKDFVSDNMHLFIGFTRELSENNSKSIKQIETTKEFVDYAIAQAPKTVNEKLDKFLYNLSIIGKTPGKGIVINNEKDYPLGYCKDASELQYYLDHFTTGDNQYLNIKDGKYCLSVKGWDRIGKLKERNINSVQCFVAMWFNDKMDNVYLNHIRKAIKRAGYKSITIPEKKHDNEVTSEILAEIRKSKFMIADFTGQRAGVYFEAGFAKGLGLKIIWTCKKDWFDNKEAETEGEYKISGQWVKGIIKEERHTHFDVNHRRFILWEDTTKDNLSKFEEDIYNSIVEQFGEGPLKDEIQDNK